MPQPYVAGTRIALVGRMGPIVQRRVARGALVAAAVFASLVLTIGLRVAWTIATAVVEAGSLAEIGGHPQSTIVFDRQDRPAFTFFVQQRIDVPLDRVSPQMVNALVAVEDRRFYSHQGIDNLRIVKAAWRNWRAGRIVEGGSTLTQQLARLEQLTPRRTWTRKIREAAIAVRLELRYTKAQILSAYLNGVYFGDGYYGVEAASRGYFGKSAADLQPHEAALLAGVIRSPTAYSPGASKERALARRNLVLRLMRDAGTLSPDEYREEIEMPLPRPRPPATVTASSPGCGRYYQEEVRRQLVARFGVQKVLAGGLRVYTGYDPGMQCAAEASIDTRIAQIARKNRSARDLEASLVALDPVSGEMRALVGGRDFEATSFNRATQARRQPGSAFKPIIYAAALERGMAPASILRNLDEPIMTANGPWLPGGDHENSEYTLRAALKISSNRAAARLLQQVGLPQATSCAARLGIESRLPSVPSLALGTGSVTLLELTSAYGVFANQGVAVAPHAITRVEDAAGRVIWADVPARHQAVSDSTAFLMSSMLADVIGSGTGTAARAAGFTLPAAGKTGTTDNYADAWFVGYTPHLVTGVWFGLDKPAPIMNRGFAAVVAVPAWAEFMKKATAADRPDWLTQPADVERVTICRASGKLATDACRYGWTSVDHVQAGLTEMPGEVVGASAPKTVAASAPVSNVYDDYFPIGRAPTEPCPLHGLQALPAAEGEAVPAAVVGADGHITWVMRNRQ
jgi:penicillin-binding protein 1A